MADSANVIDGAAILGRVRLGLVLPRGVVGLVAMQDVATYRAKLPRTCDLCIKKSQHIAVGRSYVLSLDHLLCDYKCDSCDPGYPGHRRIEGGDEGEYDDCGDCNGTALSNGTGRHSPCSARTATYHPECWEQVHAN